MKGAPWAGLRERVVSSFPAICHRRPSPRPQRRPVGRAPGREEPGQLGTGVWEASVGRWPFQGQADVWSKRGRQTVSPRSHLGLGLGPLGAWTPPPVTAPPTATPIRFLPIKQPVFLLGKPCQQWSLGKRRGGWHPGAGSPYKHGP